MSAATDSPQPAAAPFYEARMALLVATLEGLAFACLDSIELSRVSTDADDDVLARLMADRFRLMGAEIDAVLRAVGSDGVTSPDLVVLGTWLLSPRQKEFCEPMRGKL